MVEILWHSQTKGRVTENTNFDLSRRASPRPYRPGAVGAVLSARSTNLYKVAKRQSARPFHDGLELPMMGERPATRSVLYRAERSSAERAFLHETGIWGNV